MEPVFLIVSLLLWPANSYKILGLFPMPAPSHYFLGNALLKGLASKGHDVTMVSPFVEKNPPSNGSYRDIQIDNFFKTSDVRMNFLNQEDITPFFQMMMLNAIGSVISEFFLAEPKVQALLQSGEHFDLVIVEQFHDDALKGFAPHFNAPLVLLSTIGANAWVNFLVSNPAPPSFVPELSLTYPNKMNFFQRVRNTVEYVIAELNRQFIFFPKQEKIYKKYFPNGPDFYEVLYNSSLVFLNSHVSTNAPVPSVPNMIDIGGFHLSPSKPLPNDLKNLLDKEKDGFIYFSMGSNLRSSSLPDDKRDAILKTFAKLKLKVLWKWENDTLPNKPSNVETRSWLPQQDVLAHPNVKLFITHGGLLSTTEAIYHGVPMVTIPIFGDQKMNAAMAELNGFAKTIRYAEMSEEKLTEAMNEVLNNPRYRQNAQKRSKIMHDRPLSPTDTVAFWTEYVIRHQGATHLRTAAMDLAWYQYILLDVAAFLLVITLSVLYAIYFVFVKLIRLFKGKSQKPKKKVKSN